MRNWKYVAPTLIMGLFFSVADAADRSPVSINTMTPSQMRVASLGRLANVALVVRMEKHERNWELEVSCDGIDGGMRIGDRKSFKNGEVQQSIYDVPFALTPATYHCEAALRRKQEDGKIREFRDSLEVIIR